MYLSANVRVRLRGLEYLRERMTGQEHTTKEIGVPYPECAATTICGCNKDVKINSASEAPPQNRFPQN